MKKILVLMMMLVALVGGGAGSATAAASNPCTGATGVTYTHIIFWMLENHALSTTRGHMPYLDGVADGCAYLNNETAITHPSLPNYLADTSGSTWGITADGPPSTYPISGNSIFQQVGSNGWKAWAQSMSVPCKLNGGSPYAVRHNPATYYTAIRNDCKVNDVNISNMQAGLSDPATEPTYMMVIPDVCHDAHPNTCAGGSTDAGRIKQADDYLASELPVILNSPDFQAGNTLLVITWDEGHKTDQTVYTVLVGPSIVPGTVITSNLTAYSLLAYAENVAGVPCLQNACSAPTLTGPGL